MVLRPINPADISLVQGRMGRPPLPLTPGAEGLGTVEHCGQGAGSFEPGQRVVVVPSTAWSALDGSGTWQQVTGQNAAVCSAATEGKSRRRDV